MKNSNICVHRSWNTILWVYWSDQITTKITFGSSENREPKSGLKETWRWNWGRLGLILRKPAYHIPQQATEWNPKGSRSRVATKDHTKENSPKKAKALYDSEKNIEETLNKSLIWVREYLWFRCVPRRILGQCLTTQRFGVINFNSLSCSRLKNVCA